MIGGIDSSSINKSNGSMFDTMMNKASSPSFAILGDGRNSFSTILQNQLKDSHHKIAKVSEELSSIMPRMLLSEMFAQIDEESEDGGFGQGMFRYLMVDKLSEEWVKSGQMSDLCGAIEKQLGKYVKASELSKDILSVNNTGGKGYEL